jgi:hypothetical protein
LGEKAVVEEERNEEEGARETAVEEEAVAEETISEVEEAVDREPIEEEAIGENVEEETAAEEATPEKSVEEEVEEEAVTEKSTEEEVEEDGSRDETMPQESVEEDVDEEAVAEKSPDELVAGETTKASTREDVEEEAIAERSGDGTVAEEEQRENPVQEDVMAGQVPAQPDGEGKGEQPEVAEGNTGVDASLENEEGLGFVDRFLGEKSDMDVTDSLEEDPYDLSSESGGNGGSGLGDLIAEAVAAPDLHSENQDSDQQEPPGGVRRFAQPDDATNTLLSFGDTLSHTDTASGVLDDGIGGALKKNKSHFLGSGSPMEDTPPTGDDDEFASESAVDTSVAPTLPDVIGGAIESPNSPESHSVGELQGNAERGPVDNKLASLSEGLLSDDPPETQGPGVLGDVIGSTLKTFDADEASAGQKDV